MSRRTGRLSTRTLPLPSPEERAASDRGGTSPSTGRNSQGRPEPPPGVMPSGRAPPGHGSSRGDPPGFLPDENAIPWSARGSPPVLPDRWSPSLGHGPPGRSSSGTEVQRRSHGPPRQARGDPPGVPVPRRGCDPPRSRAGPAPPGRSSTTRRGPPGPTRVTYSSLSAERRRGRIPVTRPETVRQDAARKPKPKSRKITPWL